MLKSHARHADFHQVPNSFGKYVPDIGNFRRLRRYIAENSHMSQQVYEVAETKISAGPSRITRPAELNEIVQYSHQVVRWDVDSKIGVIYVDSVF